MTLRITEEDDPSMIEQRAKRCAELVLQSLPIAVARVKRQPAAVRKTITAARFEGIVPGYKSLSIAFPQLNSKGTWCVIYPWSHVEDFDPDELADYIIDTVRHQLHEDRKRGRA